MTTDATSFCYIATWPACGCIRLVTVDSPEHAKDNAKEIARCIKLGYAVNRVTVASFKVGEHGKFGCKDAANCPNPYANAGKRK